jgi:hypothetical protein
VIKGVIDEVYRDVITKTISLTLGEKKYVLREPSDIVLEQDEISFVYREYPEDSQQPLDGLSRPEEPPVVAKISFSEEEK